MMRLMAIRKHSLEIQGLTTATARLHYRISI